MKGTIRAGAIRGQDSIGDGREPRDRPGLRGATGGQGATVAFLYRANQAAADALVAELAAAGRRSAPSRPTSATCSGRTPSSINCSTSGNTWTCS